MLIFDIHMKGEHIDAEKTHRIARMVIRRLHEFLALANHMVINQVHLLFSLSFEFLPNLVVLCYACFQGFNQPFLKFFFSLNLFSFISDLQHRDTIFGSKGLVSYFLRYEVDVVQSQMELVFNVLRI